MKECDLCILDQKTRWYYEDDLIVICDCLSCRVPMIVLRKHTVRITPKIIYHLVDVSQRVFGKNIELRTQQRNIPDHLHWHIFNLLE